MPNPTADQIATIRRLAIGLRSDAETWLPDTAIIDVFTHEGGASVPLSAAACCELLAAQIALDIPKWAADGETIDKSMQPDELRKRAAELRSGHYASTPIPDVALRPTAFQVISGQRGR